MKTDKLERAQADNWKVSSAEDFLQLSDEEAQLVALKLSLIHAVKKSRIKHKLSQFDLAQRMKITRAVCSSVEQQLESIGAREQRGCDVLGRKGR